MQSPLIGMDVFHWIGFIGTTLVILAYFLLLSERCSIDSPRYHWLNLCGASLLLVSLCVHFNLGSFVIEIFWIGITLYGMLKSHKRKQAPSP